MAMKLISMSNYKLYKATKSSASGCRIATTTQRISCFLCYVIFISLYNGMQWEAGNACLVLEDSKSAVEGDGE